MSKVVFLAVLLVVPTVVYAEKQNCTVIGNQNVCGNTIGRDLNIGITDKTVKEIIELFKKQHKDDEDYIKRLTQIIEDLRSGKVKVDTSPTEIQAAFSALKKGNARLAKNLVIEEE